MKKKFIVFVYFACFVLITAVGAMLFIRRSSQDNVTRSASSDTELTEASDWTQGTSTANIDLSSTIGSIKLTSSGESTLISSGTWESDDPYPENGLGHTVALVHDSDSTTYVFISPPADLGASYIINDFGQSKAVTKTTITGDTRDPGNDATQSSVTLALDTWQSGAWHEEYTKEITYAGGLFENTFSSPVTTTKIRWRWVSGPGYYATIYEIKSYAPYSATHTSAATQIDGSEGGTKNFVAWQTFTPTYTAPANTTVSYRFRTSPDGSTWTSWSASQTPASGGAFDISSIVDSASGANKYLQVETTLSNTDGTSTPTVDSYSVGYHTNVKPDKPVAATAIVGR